MWYDTYSNTAGCPRASAVCASYRTLRDLWLSYTPRVSLKSAPFPSWLLEMHNIMCRAGFLLCQGYCLVSCMSLCGHLSESSNAPAHILTSSSLWQKRMAPCKAHRLKEGLRNFMDDLLECVHPTDLWSRSLFAAEGRFSTPLEEGMRTCWWQEARP